MLFRSSRPPTISSHGGGRRSRRTPLGLASLFPRNIQTLGKDVWEPTPFRCSRLSGTGDSDCAERTPRTASLSLRLVSLYRCNARAFRTLTENRSTVHAGIGSHSPRLHLVRLCLLTDVFLHALALFSMPETPRIHN